MFVYTAGNGVATFTLDPAIGAFIISNERIHMPEQGSIYSVNEANADSFPEPYRQFLARLRAREGDQVYSSRYIGSLVAYFHRTPGNVGTFLQPPTLHYPQI